ncbi:hypothetical protein BS47DRAFT_768392 [Hydnum rufescens UP504]|uniref:RBR-type E3 ubiquitin transferase n=1 Tax=Hydnum rufescens UP504 TaxID=1448309 RepID=A0A9P6B0T5_9AGAM|nr:hypothetical protein BS47DRAFT_768392 [Hydnum rufescens UP504]
MRIWIHSPGVLQLPCPSGHLYCVECLRGYLRASLDHVHEIGGKHRPTTSVRCPECPLSPLSSRGRQDPDSENQECHPEWGFDDNLVGMILCDEDLHRWHIKRILESIPHMRCANTECGELIEIPRNDDGLRHTQVVGSCPMCHISMCIPCESVAHPGETCETYQHRLTSDMEDQTVLSLARSQGWRRCSSCAALIEHFGGCRHMRCRCGWEFCYKCGNGWDRGKGRCGATIPCNIA